MAITLRNIAGAAGSAINKVGTALGNPFGQGIRGVDISSTLQNWGGNVAGSLKSAIVPQAYASTPSTGDYSAMNYSYYTPTTTSSQRSTSGFSSSLPSGGVATGGGDAGGGTQGPSEMDAINNEYNNYSSWLDQQSNVANQNYQSQVANLGGQRDTYKTGAKNTLDTTIADIGVKQEAGRQNERLNLQRVRQLLQDLEQRNAARSAISGGGSVSEALAERFGRTAQQNVGGVIQEGQNLQNSLETEKVKANQFYNQKVSEIDNWYNQEKSSADATLQQNLASIQSAKNESAAAKTRATVDTWKSYINNINQAKLQAAQFKMQYDTWRQQMTAQLGYAPKEIAQPDYGKYMQFLNPNGQIVNPVVADNNIYRTRTQNQEEQPLGIAG